ncbi:MAG: redoxin family protein, partial [Thaumarchaeota archaeon]|nr:redoxin family protein [Nitrososphaerota archaeon]
MSSNVPSLSLKYDPAWFNSPPSAHKIMGMLALGESAPSFENLLAADGKRYSLDSFDDRPVLAIIFSCNHCPYVMAYEDRMVATQTDYADKGVQLVAINSNDAKSYPEDSYPKRV